MDPPRPVVTENRISLDTHAWATGVLPMAVFDLERDTIEFYSTSENGGVEPVEPIALDRGLGNHPDIIQGSKDGRRSRHRLKERSGETSAK